MQRSLSTLVGFALFGCVSAAAGFDWITAPSYYTHDPQTGERVQQYSPIGPFYLPQRNDYVRSGYRHMRSSIQAGTSADHMHVVDQWGAPVQPYEDWRFPFRPYAVPAPLWSQMNPWWGAYSPHFGGGYPLGPFGPGAMGRGAMGPGAMGPGAMGPGPRAPGTYPGEARSPAWEDGNYTPFRTPRLPDRQFYWTPGSPPGPTPPPKNGPPPATN